MIGVERRTGRTITGSEQLVSRLTQVLTTPVGARAHRPAYGSNTRATHNANVSDSVLLELQAAAIDACYNPDNGVQDFTPTRCVAQRRDDGISLYFEGLWQGRPIEIEVPGVVSAS